MKFILLEAAEVVFFKAEAEVVIVEETDVEEEDDTEEEAGKNRDINGLDPMPEWYSVTMAHR